MKTTTVLATTAMLAGLMTSDAGADPWCWSLVKPTPTSGAGSCCREERHMLFGLPPNTAQVVQAPALVSGDGTRYDVFAQGFDNAIWTRHFDGADWSGWVSLGGVATSRPTAVAAGPNRVLVFVRGNNGAVWFRERTAAGWGAWLTLGGYILGGVGAAAWNSGEVEVFGHGGDHALYKNSLFEGTTTGWVSLGGTLYGEPSAAHIQYTSGEAIDVWVMRNDMQMWRRTHDRVPKKMGMFWMTVDLWRAWQAVLTGTYGGVGLVQDTYDGFVHFAMRDGGGHVWPGKANTAGVTGVLDPLPITTRTDVSVARTGSVGSERYAYVDRNSFEVKGFHTEDVCSACGDGRCYGTESCGDCPADCGPCTTTPPPPACDTSFLFCKKPSLAATSGTPVTVKACSIEEARKLADKKVIGGILSDGPCPPPVCGGSPGAAVEFCCEDTGTTYGGVACDEDAAENAAKAQDTGCDSWTEGWCTL